MNNIKIDFPLCWKKAFFLSSHSLLSCFCSVLSCPGYLRNCARLQCKIVCRKLDKIIKVWMTSVVDSIHPFVKFENVANNQSVKRVVRTLSHKLSMMLHTYWSNSDCFLSQTHTVLCMNFSRSLLFLLPLIQVLRDSTFERHSLN